MRKLVLGILASAVLVLAGCASPQVAEPVAVPTSVAAPTVTAQPEISIVIGPTGVDILEDDAITSTIDRTADVDASVAQLTEVFGFAPTVSAYPGTHHADVPGTDYSWNGFVLRVRDRFEEVPLIFYLDMHSTTAAVGDIGISLGNGLAVGSTVDDVRAAAPDGETTQLEDQTVGLWFSFEPTAVTVDGNESSVRARLEVDTTSGLVIEIYN